MLAVATMGPGNAAAKAANQMFEGKMPSASQIRSVHFPSAAQSLAERKFETNC